VQAGGMVKGWVGNGPAVTACGGRKTEKQMLSEAK
jgi:hypothetical protein